jgi:hypothetical protein
MAKSGHHFPSRHGFSSSSGGVQQVRAHTRAAPKKFSKGGMAAPPMRGLPVAMAGRPSLPSPKGAPLPRSSVKPSPLPPRMGIPTPPGRTRAYAGGGYVIETIGDQGNSVTRRGNPPITESDRTHGGRGPLLPGLKRGGSASKGFNKSPLFGKK